MFFRAACSPVNRIFTAGISNHKYKNRLPKRGSPFKGLGVAEWNLDCLVGLDVKCVWPSMCQLRRCLSTYRLLPLVT